jgi:hypothetical protein
MLILYVMHRDMLHNRKILKQYEFIYFYIGFDLKLSDIMKTCLVCFDERNLDQFELKKPVCIHLIIKINIQRKIFHFLIIGESSNLNE